MKLEIVRSKKPSDPALVVVIKDGENPYFYYADNVEDAERMIKEIKEKVG